MSTITVCYRNNFRLGSSKKYAVLSFKDDGIKIICTDEYPENFDTLVLALNYRNQCIYLPSVVMDAYGLGKSIYNVEVLDENRFFIRKPKLYDLTFEKPTADKEERTYSLIQKYRTKRINEYKMSVSRKENISMSYKVDMYFGERNYAKITSVPIIPDGANTIDDIKDIYGATEGMIIESKRLLRLLYETKNIEDFNKVLKELLSVCPRKVWKVEELLASSSDQIPEVIQREEDLVMAMQVVNGNQKKDLSFNAFDRYDISVSIPSEEKRQKVLELLAPELRRKVTNIYRIKTSKQEKKFKTYLKERNISEIKSLWHGSRNENWLSIVENSLSLNPNAVITGKMFGNGIYFAPNSLKSWGYTSGGYWTREMSNPTRFMGLYATAYGEPLNVSSPGQYSESKIGHHGCVHAHAGSYLRNDEIIFYNESAMLLTYLVEFAA